MRLPKALRGRFFSATIHNHHRPTTARSGELPACFSGFLMQEAGGRSDCGTIRKQVSKPTGRAVALAAFYVTKKQPRVQALIGGNERRVLLSTPQNTGSPRGMRRCCRAPCQNQTTTNPAPCPRHGWLTVRWRGFTCAHVALFFAIATGSAGGIGEKRRWILRSRSCFELKNSQIIIIVVIVVVR